MASGYTTSNVFQDERWDGSNRQANYVNFEAEVILPVGQELSLDRITRECPGYTWKRIYASGQTLPMEVADRLERLWSHHLVQLGLLQNVFPNELSESVRYIEGATHRVLVNAYERNPLARRACIEHYGPTCVVCGFDFEAVYGEIGQGFIHVHHLVDVASIQSEYEVDPIVDMRPVCPNCHAMLHVETPAMSIERLQSICDSQSV